MNTAILTENHMEEKCYHIHISPQKSCFDLKLNEIRQYKDLIFLFTKQTFTVSYKQTILGPLWLFLNPLLSSIIYTLVFGTIAGLSTDGVPKLLFYLVGNAFWEYFSSCLTNNQSVFIGHANLFGKVYFPRLVIPLSNVLSNTIKLGIQLLLVSGFLIYYCIAGAVTPNLAALPLLIPAVFQLGLLGMGCGIIASGLTTKYRDLTVLISFGVRLWMYATPVIYPMSQIPDGLLKKLVLLNPVTQPMEQLRFAILGVGTVNLDYSILSWAITIALAIAGIMIFNRVERTFIDTV